MTGGRNVEKHRLKSLGKTCELRTGSVWAAIVGTGGPAVVVLSGAGTVAIDYYMIQQLLAKDATVLIYDRLGTGFSALCNLPRTSKQVVEELKELLQFVKLPGPYILVGHSLGGLYARHFTTLYPRDVVGLVLLDPAHEDYDLFMPEELNRLGKVPSAQEKQRLIGRMRPTHGPGLLARIVRNPVGKWLLERVPAIAKYRDTYVRLFTEEMKNWPPEIATELVTAHVDLEWGVNGLREASNAYAVFEEVRNAGSIPNVPTKILCSMQTDGFRRAVLRGETEELIAAEIEGKRGSTKTI